MFSSDLFEPRDPEGACRFAATVSFVAGGLSTAMTALVPQDIAPGMKLPIIGASLSIMVVGLLLLTVKDPLRRWLLVAVPLLGIVAITATSLGTKDASASGQVFLCAPVLFAASQMRRELAWFVCSCAIAADAVITFTLLPFERALTDLVFVGSAGALITWLLVRGADRNDALVSELRAQAAIDPLTGLVTRRVLDRAAHSVLGRESADEGTALLVLDVDRFKAINDTWGHPVGDAALVHIAEVLRSLCRADTVISRLGGDELALLLPGCPYDVAIQRAQGLVDAVRTTPLTLPDGEELALSISVGVAHATTESGQLRELYTAADESLYDAKRNGRGRVGDGVRLGYGDPAGV